VSTTYVGSLSDSDKIEDAQDGMVVPSLFDSLAGLSHSLVKYVTNIKIN
jgi:hypothetical protein